MSDEDALLAAIAAHPDEDTPRLAYADWLDEHDRHTLAEFIRVQIDISHKETLARVDQNRYVHVWKRNQELLDHHRDELLGPLAGVPKDVTVEFSRGFVSELAFDAQRWHEYARAVAALKPRPEVAVRDGGHALVHGGLWDDLSAALVTSLRMQSDRRPAPVALWEVHLDIWVRESDPWLRLRELDLAGCPTGDAGLRVLLAAHEDHFPSLTDLDVSSNEISDMGVLSLVNSTLWPRLKRLVLGGNPLTDESARLLADAADTNRLEYLNLKFTDIGQPGHQALTARFGGRIDLF